MILGWSNHLKIFQNHSTNRHAVDQQILIKSALTYERGDVSCMSHLQILLATSQIHSIIVSLRGQPHWHLDWWGGAKFLLACTVDNPNARESTKQHFCQLKLEFEGVNIVNTKSATSAQAFSVQNLEVESQPLIIIILCNWNFFSHQYWIRGQGRPDWTETRRTWERGMRQRCEKVRIIIDLKEPLCVLKTNISSTLQRE